MHRARRVLRVQELVRLVRSRLPKNSLYTAVMAGFLYDMRTVAALVQRIDRLDPLLQPARDRSRRAGRRRPRSRRGRP